jgi:hypothetical protein
MSRKKGLSKFQLACPPVSLIADRSATDARLDANSNGSGGSTDDDAPLCAPGGFDRDRDRDGERDLEVDRFSLVCSLWLLLSAREERERKALTDEALLADADTGVDGTRGGAFVLAMSAG